MALYKYVYYYYYYYILFVLEGCTVVVCEAACCMEVRRGLWGGHGGASAGGGEGGQVDVWRWAEGQTPKWGVERETGCGWHSIGVAAEQAVLVWACAVKRG